MTEDDEPCPECGHGIDADHDPANFCLNPDHGPEGADEPCAIRYDAEGRVIRRPTMIAVVRDLAEIERIAAALQIVRDLAEADIHCGCFDHYGTKHWEGCVVGRAERWVEEEPKADEDHSVASEPR